MFKASPGTLGDVVDWGLCIGCGACVPACARGGVRMVHVEREGYRPVFDDPDCRACTACTDICPGARVDGTLATGALPVRTTADHEFGPALEVWEGWAADPDVRFRASSGGLLSALSLYCLEREGFGGVVHAGMDPDAPWMNRTRVSGTREEIRAQAGSRYAPSDPCAAIADIGPDAAPHVFIGKPCDTAAVTALQRRDRTVRERIGLVLTFFCAGTPSTRGTLDLLQQLDVAPEQVSQLHYRGEGWPGRFRVSTDGRDVRSLSYRESWGALTAYRPLRCHLCPDGLGRVADLACGDAWDHYSDTKNDPGRSLVVVRTERGREMLARARRAGYVVLEQVEADRVLRAQANLLERRRALFGRLLAFRLLGVPVPAYHGFSLLRSWLRLGPVAQVTSVGGTLRRILRRGWHRRRPRLRPDTRTTRAVAAVPPAERNASLVDHRAGK